MKIAWKVNKLKTKALRLTDLLNTQPLPGKVTSCLKKANKKLQQWK